MKKVFTMITAIILTASLTAAAADGKPDQQNGQKSSYQLSFAKLQVSNDIDIMLVESPEKSIEFEGTDADVAKVDWKIKDGVLYIHSKKGSLKGKVRLIVNVSQLNELAVNGDSEVRSVGELHSDYLRIYLNGNSFISVRNRGNINVVNGDGTELEVRRVVGNVVFG